MRILIVHTTYRQRGGEDVVVRLETDLLRANGHEVDVYMRSNTELSSGLSAVKMPLRAIWSYQARNDIERKLDSFQPDVVHFHNTWLMISPGAYHTVSNQGIPVIQTLHNYRLLCPNATFFREGKPCELCKEKVFPFAGVRYACYRHSRAQTAMVGTTIAAHRLLGTWKNHVDVYIALTEFARQKFIEGGLPSEKIVVKPNFVHPDPGPSAHHDDYALFVGRLSPEKGIEVLLNAWEKLGSTIHLKIAGTGPLAPLVQQAAQKNDHIEWVGHLPPDAVFDAIGKATFLVFPSLCYETFGLVAIEAYAKATPVVASNVGAIAEIVDHERTGLLFSPGDANDLAAKVAWLLAHPAQYNAMRREARTTFETTYTAEQNYHQLIHIYETAIAGSKTRAHSLQP